MKIYSHCNREDQLQLDGSFMPIFHCMRIFGIDLGVHGRCSFSRRVTFTLMALIVCTWTASSNWNRPDSGPRQPPDLTSTQYWLNECLANAWNAWYFTMPLVMFEMATLLKWRRVRMQLQQLQESLSFPPTLHYSLRRVSIASVSYALLSVNWICLLFLLVSDAFPVIRCFFLYFIFSLL